MVVDLSNGDEFNRNRFFNHFNGLQPIERSGLLRRLLVVGGVLSEQLNPRICFAAQREAEAGTILTQNPYFTAAIIRASNSPACFEARFG
jgi:hypothetical protein